MIQNTKQGLVFAFNRETGEPIWPIEQRPVIQTQVPGNYTAATQAYPTLPAPLDSIILTGLTEDYVIDYTPDLKAQAQIILSQYQVGGLYVPPLPFDHDNDFVNNVGCQGAGNVIPHPPVADPSTGMMYASHRRTCSAPGFMRPTNGVDVDNPELCRAGGRRRDPQLYAHHGHHGGSVGAGRRRWATDHRWPADLETHEQPALRLPDEHGREDLVVAGRPDA